MVGSHQPSCLSSNHQSKVRGGKPFRDFKTPALEKSLDFSAFWVVLVHGGGGEKWGWGFPLGACCVSSPPLQIFLQLTVPVCVFEISPLLPVALFLPFMFNWQRTWILSRPSTSNVILSGSYSVYKYQSEYQYRYLSGNSTANLGQHSRKGNRNKRWRAER